MAGAGIKIFTNSEVLSANEINSYLMDQAVAVFETPEDRTFAFGTGIGGDNKPVLSEGRVCYIKSTNSLEIYDGAAWQPTTSVIGSGAIDGDKIASNAITTTKIDNNAVTAAKINTSAIGSGLVGGGGSAISVNVDNSTVEISSNQIIVKDDGITQAKIAPAAIGVSEISSSIAGNGLSGGSGSALSVGVDNTTIEINTDNLRVKDLGITTAKIANANITNSKIDYTTVPQLTVSTSDPAGGKNGDIWVKVI